MKRDPSRETYDGLSRAYDLFNEELFEARLPPCLITLRARGRTFGYFCPDRFTNNGVFAHEIALNPESFSSRTIEACLSTLAHEMVHLDQYLHRDPKPRRGYHDHDFAERMERIGLITSNTGAPGGHRVGPQMTHYIDANAGTNNPFLRVARKLIDSDFQAQWGDRFIKEIPQEWTPGKPARVPKNVPPEKIETVLAAAMAAGASPMSQDPEPIDPGEARQKKLRELGHTAQPGGVVPTLARRPDDFIVAEPRKTGGTRDPSKTKFQCPANHVAVWGKASLNVLCGTCMAKLRTAEELAEIKARAEQETEQQGVDAGTTAKGEVAA